tara:strand:+ start:52862 stop:53395 length:534 start_codon:yes stop_codon:yes gene_type:complete
MLKNFSKIFFLILTSSLLITGCRDKCDSEPNLDVDQDQLAIDVAKIDAYLETKRAEIEANGNTIEIHPSGIRYVIKRKGTGDRPKICDDITVTYEGKVISTGFSFDKSTNLTSIDLGNTITGWQIGLPLIKDGGGDETGRITLYIPSVYGYGATGRTTSGIPSNANLQFEVLLFDIR